MPLHGTNRRTVLLAAGATIAGALSGCSEVASELPGNDGEDDGTEAELRALIEDYFAAAEAENLDDVSTIVHPSSPLHPDHWEDSEWEFQGYSADGDATDVDYEIDAVRTDATVDDVRALEYAEFWFEGDELETILDGRDLAIVELDSETLEAAKQDVWVFATEDESWRLFFASTESSVPEDPETVFEEPIRDEDHAVVKTIEWDYEPSSTGSGGGEQDAKLTKVVLTDSPGLEADTIRIESTIADAEAEFYSEENGPVSSTWAGSWASIPIHPEGDQIVVTAIEDGEKTIVHRVHYEP